MKKNRKLQNKITIVVVIFAFVLSSITVLTSYFRYKKEFEEHYIELTTNVAATAARVIDPWKVQDLKDRVMDIYRENHDYVLRTDEDYANYFALYDETHDEIYYELMDFLMTIKENNNVLYVYLSFLDDDTKAGVYLADADESSDQCPTGYWDVIYPENYDNLKTSHQTIPAFISHSDDEMICSAGVAVRLPDGEIVGHVFADISMTAIHQEQQEFLFLLEVSVLMITFLGVIALNFFFHRSVVRPINLMAEATRTYLEDQQEGEAAYAVRSPIAQLQLKTGDEIQNLCAGIQKMEENINCHIDEITQITAEKERIGTELAVATEIQASMLPTDFTEVSEREEFEIFASMTPAKEVGGDFYDFFFVDDDHLGLVMADVSGKGVPAALFMVVAKTLIKNAAQSGRNPSEVLETVNNQLCENNEAGMFVTVWIGILELSTGVLFCSSAGHEYPALKRSSGTFELVVEKQGFVLAGMECTKYRQYEMQLQKGDVLYLYTDGVPEAVNYKEEFFGKERMLASLNRAKTTNPEELLQVMATDVNRFIGYVPQFDDLTMLSIRYNGSKKSDIGGNGLGGEEDKQLDV